MEKKTNKTDDKEIKSYKEMLIYEMKRTEKLDNEIRHYKNRIRNLEEYVDNLERKTHLY